MKKQLITVLLMLTAAVSSPIEADAMFFEEGDRYRPSTCTVYDEEGPL